MAVVVVVDPRAREMLDQIDRYWFQQRGLAENPLDVQLQELLVRLASYPEIGTAVHRRRVPTRRYVLRCGWTVYYEYPSVEGAAKIVAIWHSARGGAPPV